jgi:hypothetical protein
MGRAGAGFPFRGPAIAIVRLHIFVSRDARAIAARRNGCEAVRF